MEMRKRHYFSYHSSVEKMKMLHKYECYTFELPLIKLCWLDKRKLRKHDATSKRYILGERAQKLKNNFLFHDYFSKFCS